MNDLKKKYKKIKEVIKRIKDGVLTFFIVTELLAFGTWIIGGNIYNYVAKDQIKKDMVNLEHELYTIDVIKEFNISNISWPKGKALIAIAICATLEPKDSDIEPILVKETFVQYFVSQDWHITANRSDPHEYIKAENQEYIITLERISSHTNQWRIVIRYNTFFEKYNL